MGEIFSQMFIYKDVFSIKLPTKVDTPLNSKTKCIYPSIYKDIYIERERGRFIKFDII